jgi:PAS domain S-box-containing protein
MKAEKALKLAIGYNRGLIDSSLDPLFITDPDGKITDVNKAVEKATGYSREELLGTNFTNYFTEPGKARENYQLVFREGSVLDQELEIKHKDGHVNPVLYNSLVNVDESGKVIGVFAAARDITERKRVEEMLKESEGKLKTLFNLLSVGVSITDKERNVLNVNFALESILSLPRSDLLKGKYGTQKYLRSNGTEMPAEEFPSVRALKEEGSIQSSEMGIIKEDGSTIWTDVSATALPFYDGQVVIITRDITERKKAEEKIQILVS